MIRFDFAAYGNMPPLKVFWYDGMKENPKIAGVPEGEWVGDPPSVRPPAGQAPQRGPAPRAAGADFQSPGRVYNAAQFDALKAAGGELRFPTPNGSVFIGDKGLLAQRCCQCHNARPINIGQQQRRTFGGEALGNCLADPLRRASDDRSLAA